MNRKTVIADTHVHFYPCYDFQQVWSAVRLFSSGGARSSAQRFDPACLRALFLAERSDMHYFRQFQNGQHPFGDEVVLRPLPAGAGLPPGRSAPSGAAVSFADREGHEILVIAGRQIVTRERLEVVALTVDLELPDGRPAEEVVAAIRAAGGLPLLNWAPGKWLGARGKIVAALIDQATPGTLFIGDTTLRPAGCPEAVLMRRAAARGLPILAGSDPLPFRGEEQKIGQYGIKMEMDWNPDAIVDSLRSHLTKAGSVRRVGRRDSLVSVFRRLWILRQQKKTGSARHG